MASDLIDSLDSLVNDMDLTKILTPEDEYNVLLECSQRKEYLEKDYIQDTLRFKRYLKHLNFEGYESIFDDIIAFLALGFDASNVVQIAMLSNRINNNFLVSVAAHF
jgi:hypothetical protein